MPKFTFTCEHEHPLKKDVNISTITYESNREYLGDILEDFRDFLKGCGFQIDGEIDIVTEEESETITFNTMNDSFGSSGGFNQSLRDCTITLGDYDGR